MPGVEEWVLLVAIFMAGTFVLTGVKLFKPNSSKNKPKTRKDNANEALDKVNDETIDRLTDQLKKEAGRANRLQALKDKFENISEDSEDSQQKQVTFEEIEALVKQTYPKYALMLPVMKKQIMEITKGMSLEQVLDYVRQITGDKQPSTGTNPESATFNPNWA